MTMYQNQLKVRLPYFGTNKSEPTELLPTIKRTSQPMTMKKEHAC